MLATWRSLAPPVLLTPGFWLLTSALPTNKAGILLIAQDLNIYLIYLRNSIVNRQFRSATGVEAETVPA